MKKFYTIILLISLAFAMNARYLSKDFDDSSITSGGWTTQNVVGAINWTIYTSGTPCASIKNWDGTANIPCETWLISPAVDLTSTTQPTLTFKNACSYDGADLVAYVSTNYSGSGSPSAATWTPLTFTLSTGFFAWANSGDIDLSAYKTSGVYIAFKYTGSDADGKTWELDDILIDEYAPFVPVVTTLPHLKDFNDNDLYSGGWTMQTVVGTTNWFVSLLGEDYFAKITNYSGGANTAAESWLISPGFKLTGTPEVILTFRNAFKYTGDPLKLMVSNNYTGEGAPSAATWTDITSSATWSAGEWVFTGSGDVTLPSYTNDTIYIAFKYTGSATDGSTWEVDDINLTASPSIGENNKLKFEMYPNPATDKLSIKSEMNFESVQIYNVAGEVVLDKYCNSKSQVLDLSKFDKGVYVVKVNYLNEAGITSKIVIE